MTGRTFLLLATALVFAAGCGDDPLVLQPDPPPDPIGDLLLDSGETVRLWPAPGEGLLAQITSTHGATRRRLVRTSVRPIADLAGTPVPTAEALAEGASQQGPPGNGLGMSAEGVSLVEVSQSIEGDGAFFRLTRRFDPDLDDGPFHSRIDIPGETQILEGVPAGNALVLHLRWSQGDHFRARSFRVDRERVRNEPRYRSLLATRLQIAFAEFLPGSRLARDSEFRLLKAILEHPGLERLAEDYLDAHPGEHGILPNGVLPTTDAQTELNIQRLCVSASFISSVACPLAPFFPGFWAVCIPAKGIAMACGLYQVIRLFQGPGDDDDWNRPPPDPEPDPDPGP